MSTNDSVSEPKSEVTISTSQERHQELQTAALPLDASLYTLEADEVAFFKAMTGIEDDEELKGHILSVQEEAYKVYPYPCIRRFAFSRLKISRHPKYQLLLEKKEDQSAIFLDIGCCFGNDARKAAWDGFPASQIVASDLRPEFWELGRKLFKVDSEPTRDVHFIAGNAFDDAFLDMSRAQTGNHREDRSNTVLKNLTSLTPLQGRLSAIHAASLFHLFNEEDQLSLARRLSSLLSDKPGSIIFGSHGGKMKKGHRIEAQELRPVPMFCHSEESWRELWNGVVFERDSVCVETWFESMPREGDGEFGLLSWSVIRL